MTLATQTDRLEKLALDISVKAAEARMECKRLRGFDTGQRLHIERIRGQHDAWRWALKMVGDAMQEDA